MSGNFSILDFFSKSGKKTKKGEEKLEELEEEEGEKSFDAEGKNQSNFFFIKDINKNAKYDNNEDFGGFNRVDFQRRERKHIKMEIENPSIKKNDKNNKNGKFLLNFSDMQKINPNHHNNPNLQTISSSTNLDNNANLKPIDSLSNLDINNQTSNKNLLNQIIYGKEQEKDSGSSSISSQIRINSKPLIIKAKRY